MCKQTLLFHLAALSPTHENIDLYETQARSEAQRKSDSKKKGYHEFPCDNMIVMFDGGDVSAEIIVSIKHSSHVCYILAANAAFVNHAAV